jgi:hypothetical protein
VTAADLVALRARKDALTAELQRVRSAIAMAAEEPAGTCDMLREYAKRVPEFDAHKAYRFLVGSGWVPELRENPLNSIRSSMAQLARLGEIERVRCGVYRACGPGRALHRGGGR